MFKKILIWMGRKLAKRRECRAGHHEPVVGFTNDYCGLCGVVLNTGPHARLHDMVRRNELNLPDVPPRGMFYADATTFDGSNPDPILTCGPYD